MEDKSKKEIFIINSLKIVASIQLVILLCTISILTYKVLDYEYFGETSYFWQSSFSRCMHDYGCKCPKGGGKCTCIYYNDEKSREEKMKCRPTIYNK